MEEQGEGGDYGCFVRLAIEQRQVDIVVINDWATEGDNREGDKREIVRRFEHLIKRKKIISRDTILLSLFYTYFLLFISIILFDRAIGWISIRSILSPRISKEDIPCLLEGRRRICVRGMDEGQETGKRGIKIRCWLGGGGSDRGLRHVGKLRDGSVGVRRTRGIHRGILSHSLKRASTGNTNAATWSPCRGTG